MALNILGQFQFGGVDSQSNPINMPPSRSLRCRNWAPKADGHLELRYGYTTVNMSTVTAQAINSPYFYRKWDGGKNVVFFQGTTPKNGAISGSTVTVSSPTLRGVAIASTASWSFYNVNNRIHAGNGTDQKWFDGTMWRDSGIRGPNSTESGGVSVAVGTANANALPASSVGGTQPGYQFHMAYYNPTTGHVGNRAKIGTRVAPGTASEISISGLPNLSGVDTELVKLIGRTGDGGEVPYAVADAVGNWISAGNTASSIVINVAGIDGAAELPSRNGVIPAGLDKFALVSDRIYGAGTNSPTIYRSGSALDERSGDFVGRPEQSWAGNDIETFPTAEPVTCIAEVESEVFAASLNDCAILSDVLGALLWRGPWNLGCAGKRAFAKTPYGFFWLTGDKQLATFKEGGPVVVSAEYERALLAQIGDAFLGDTECIYVRDPAIDADVLMVKAKDAGGNPFQVIHDFALADERSSAGQAYEAAYVGQLASDYTLVSVRDAIGKARLWAGAGNGRFYQLLDGANDGGSEFVADYIALLNCGQERLGISWLDWVGDQKVQVSIGRTLKTSLATGSQFSPEVLVAAEAAEAVSGEENNFQFRAKLKNRSVTTCICDFS